MIASRLALAAVALATAGAAQATSLTSFKSLQVGPTAGQTTLFDFESNSSAVTGTGSWGYYTGTTASVAAAPAGNTSRYLAVQSGGSVAIAFASALTNFSIDFGSVDTFNSLTVNYVGGGSQTFTGSQLTGLGQADGNQSIAATNGRATFTADAGQQIRGLTLASQGNSFEVDNIGTTPAVPEPATWALMIAGMGLTGAMLRRSRQQPLATAA